MSDPADQQQPPGTPQAEPPPAIRAEDFASIGDRLLAQLIDGLVAFGVFFLTGMPLALRLGGLTETGFNLTGWPAAVSAGVTAVVLLLYFVFMEGHSGVTLGKLVAGVKVQTPTGGHIGLRAALIRNLMRIIDGIGVYLVGGFTILVSKRCQRLGDMAAGSVVVRHESGRAVRVLALLVPILFLVAGVVAVNRLRPVGPQIERAQPGAPRFARAVLSDEEEGKTEKTRFSPDTVKVYIAFALVDVPEDTAVRSVWIAEKVEGLDAEAMIGERELKAGGRLNKGHFSLSRPSYGWLPGTYRVELYIAGQLARTARFEIERP